MVRSVLSGLPTAQQQGSAVYSSACFKHCTSDIGSFWGVRVNGVPLSAFARNWYDGVASAGTGFVSQAVPSMALVEGCTGFGNGKLGCGECHAKAPPIVDRPPLPSSMLHPPPAAAARATAPRGMRPASKSPTGAPTSRAGQAAPAVSSGAASETGSVQPEAGSRKGISTLGVVFIGLFGTCGAISCFFAAGLWKECVVLFGGQPRLTAVSKIRNASAQGTSLQPLLVGQPGAAKSKRPQSGGGYSGGDLRSPSPA